MSRKSVDQWFAEYGESHQNRANALLHWICVPMLFFSLLGFAWAIPVPAPWEPVVPWFNWSLVAIAVAFGFYAWLSLPLAVGLLCFMSMCHAGLLRLDFYGRWPVWAISLVLLVAAWTGQFIGHRIEGKKPSFLKGVLFQLIGPAWLMSRIYRAVRLKY
jgi:uncharacterized membrane protein YGL010W